VLLSARSESGKTNKQTLNFIVDFNLTVPKLIVSNIIIFLLWVAVDSVAAVDAALNAVP